MTVSDNHNRSNQGNATSAQEADALDQWLESQSHRERHPERGRGTSRRSDRTVRSDNGLTGKGESLASVAQRAHASIAAAEQKSGPPVPVDAIWEEIMNNTTTATIGSRPAGILVRSSTNPGVVIPTKEESSRRPIPGWLSGSHWVVSAVLIAALVVGILALYQSFAGTPGGPGDDPTINPGLAAGTPGSTPPIDTAANLAPISPEECEVEPRSLEEVSALMEDPGESAPRLYQPAVAAEFNTGLQVSEANRTWRSCTLYGLAGDFRAMESPRFFLDRGNSLAGIIAQDEIDEVYESMRYLAETALDPDWRTYRIESATFGQEADSILGDEPWRPVAEMGSVMLPEQMVLLPDGRVGGPVSIVHAPFAPGFDPFTGRESLEVQFAIFVQDSTQEGAWVIDEMMWLCAGECDAYWQILAQNTGHDAGTPAPATATPVSGQATPAAESELQPITAGECDVEERAWTEMSALAEDAGELPPRSYDVGPKIDLALAEQLAQIDRAWQSCERFGTVQQQAALESPRLIGEGPVSTLRSGQELEFLARHDATRDLAAAISTGDWSDYSVPAAAVIAGGITNIIPAAPLPEQAVALADGRVAIPVAELVGYAGYWVSEAFLSNPAMIIIVDVLIQDASQDGRWVVDERIALCLGDCNAYRQFLVQDIFERGLSPGVATPEASPAATPQAVAPYRNL